eukprot:GHUV01044540.1.p1 GENE.GHUV01044540.1~~GHUV01044540.1.p1  ORF type:complete len:118 (-),score=20.51 GHUV01044540.1:405-758(-)
MLLMGWDWSCCWTWCTATSAATQMMDWQVGTVRLLHLGGYRHRVDTEKWFQCFANRVKKPHQWRHVVRIYSISSLDAARVLGLVVLLDVVHSILAVMQTMEWQAVTPKRLFSQLGHI